MNVAQRTLWTTCIMVCGTGLVQPVDALDCFPYDDYLAVANTIKEPMDNATIVNSTVYIVNTSDGVSLYDCSDPRNLVLVCTLNLPGATAASAIGEFVYVTTSSSLFIWDVTEPSAPLIVGSITLPGCCADALWALVGVVGIRDWEMGWVTLVDVSDPYAPVLGATLGLGAATPLPPNHVCDISDGDLTIQDVSDPSAPIPVSFLDLPVGASNASCAGGVLAVTDGETGYLCLVDVSDPQVPAVRSSEYIVRPNTDDYIVGLTATGGRVLVHTATYQYSNGVVLRDVNVQNPMSPFVVGSRVLMGPYYSIIADEDVGLLYDGSDPILLDLTRVEGPQTTDILWPGEYFSQFEFIGENACVLTNDTFAIYDVSDPYAPVLIDAVTSADSDYVRFTVSGSYAVISRNTGAVVEVVDISEPSELVILGETSVPGYVLALEPGNGFVYAACAPYYFCVIDIGIPSQPVVRGVLDSHYSYDMSRFGNHVYLATGWSLVVVDVSDPDNPAQLIVDGNISARSVLVEGGRLFIGGDTHMSAHTLSVYGLTTPTDYELIGETTIPGCTALVKEGDTLYLAPDIFGVGVVDISNESAPEYIGGIVLDDPATAMALGDTWILVSLQGGGTVLVPKHCADPVSVFGIPEGPCFSLVNYPNPFNPQTTISYELPEPTLVTLRIFDVAGRLVDVLVEGEVKAAGTHMATWTGRDSHDRALPSGTYFYRLEADGVVETRRMTLIR